MNEYQKPSKLGYSYQDVRSMSDVQILRAAHDCGDRLAAELANRLDLALERERDRDKSAAPPDDIYCDCDMEGKAPVSHAGMCPVYRHWKETPGEETCQPIKSNACPKSDDGLHRPNMFSSPLSCSECNAMLRAAR